MPDCEVLATAEPRQKTHPFAAVKQRFQHGSPGRIGRHATSTYIKLIFTTEACLE
jgi:hypothetical protein